EGVANDILDAWAREIEVDVPGFLLRTFLVEEAPRQECRLDGIVARAPGFGNRRGHRYRWYGGQRGFRRRWLVGLLLERSEHPRVFFPAGDAEIEPRLALVGDRVRIIIAIVAALTAILLGHRRHHPPPQWAAFGKLHALGDRQRLVVPG